MRKASTHLDRRILRRLTWTGTDGLDQFSKLRNVFEAAHYDGKYFQNRALFADHYLESRLFVEYRISQPPARLLAGPVPPRPSCLRGRDPHVEVCARHRHRRGG